MTRWASPKACRSSSKIHFFRVCTVYVIVCGREREDACSGPVPVLADEPSATDGLIFPPASTGKAKEMLASM